MVWQQANQPVTMLVHLAAATLLPPFLFFVSQLVGKNKWVWEDEEAFLVRSENRWSSCIGRMKMKLNSVKISEWKDQSSWVVCIQLDPGYKSEPQIFFVVALSVLRTSFFRSKLCNTFSKTWFFSVCFCISIPLDTPFPRKVVKGSSLPFLKLDGTDVVCLVENFWKVSSVLVAPSSSFFLFRAVGTRFLLGKKKNDWQQYRARTHFGFKPPLPFQSFTAFFSPPGIGPSKNSQSLFIYFELGCKEKWQFF